MKILELFASILFRPKKEPVCIADRQELINRFLFGYGENFHCKDEQYFRFNRAMDPDKIGSIKSLDKGRMQMRISGCYHPEQVYSVSLDSCECMDFRERHLPCKHIYKLALETGIIFPDWDLSGLSPELKKQLSSLSESQQKALLRLINKQGARNSSFNTGKGTVPSALVKNDFIVEESQYTIIDQNYTRKELMSFLQLSDNFSLTDLGKKEDIINYVIQNEPKLAKTLSQKFYRVKYSEMTWENFEFIRRYLMENFEN